MKKRNNIIEMMLTLRPWIDACIIPHCCSQDLAATHLRSALLNASAAVLTTLKDKGRNLSIAARIPSEPKSISERNFRPTLKSASRGHGWNQSGGRVASKEDTRCQPHFCREVLSCGNGKCPIPLRIRDCGSLHVNSFTTGFLSV